MMSNGRQNDDSKIIVRQLDFTTTQTTIEQYFSDYGYVREIQMKFNEQGRSKGFCFVVFNESSVLEEVLGTEHFIDGKKVQVRRAAGEANTANMTKKLFCGGLPHALSEEDLSEYFIQYGAIDSFEFIYEKGTQVRKHFCFIVFEDAGSVEKIVEGKLPPGSVVHHIGNYRVECKKKFEDNHPIQKKVKRETNLKKPDYHSHDRMDYGPPSRGRGRGRGEGRGRGRGRGEGRGRGRGAAYHSAPSYHPPTSYSDPYSAYPEEYAEEGYGADPYSSHYHADPYSSYPSYAERGAGYPAVSGYSSYPGYESEYGAALPSGGGPMKGARGGARGAARGAYRPY